jgi:peptidoglycan hydrolase CwlO-like protein
LDAQLEGLDEIKAEKQREQAQLDALRQSVKGMQIELKEATDQYNAIAKKAHDALAEYERLQAEIKKLREEQGQLSAWREKMLQQLQR